MDKIIITGATGFIGSHIVKYFTDRRITVSCLVRATSIISQINRSKVALHYGDIRNIFSLSKAFKGHNVVIHNAAYVYDWGKSAVFYDTNVVGTRNVLAACKENGIKRVLMTGSVSSYGEENCLDVKNELCEDNPHYHYPLETIFPCKMNYYRESKAEAIQEAVSYAQENDIDLTILEPVWVYGEREFHTFIYPYLKAVKKGIPFTPGSKTNKFQMIYAGDLAKAFFLSYKKRLKGVHRIIIGNQKAEHMETLLFHFCAYAGLKKPPILPKCICLIWACILEFLATITGSKKPPLLTRARVCMFYDSLEYATHKAETLLGFKADHSMLQGIQKTINWYKDNNYL